MAVVGHAQLRATAVVANDPLMPNVIELGALLALVLVCIISDPSDDQAYAFINWIAPIWLICALGYGAMRMVQINAAGKWMTLFWFRVSTALYFGVGSLVPAYTNFDTLRYIDSFFQSRPEHYFKLNTIVAASAFTVLVTSGLLSLVLKPGVRQVSTRNDDRRLRNAGIVFAIVGVPVKYFVLIPAALGAYGDAIIPGILQSVGLLVPVAIYMLSLFVLRRHRSLLVFVLLLLIVDVTSAVIRFNKSDAIVSLLVFLLAFLTDSKKTSRLLVSAGLVVFLFASIMPLTDYGRAEMMARYGSINGGTLSERFNVLWLSAGDGLSAAVDGDVQLSIVRISYTNAAGFAISEFDRGHAGNSLDNTLFAVVPRLMWPNKPNITDIGAEFNAEATGNANSSSSPGLFAESYWALGWWGIPALMPLIGIIFTVSSRHAQWVIYTHRWWYFPLVLFAMRMGLRVDGYFVVDIIGPTATFVVFQALAYGAERVLSRRRIFPAVR